MSGKWIIVSNRLPFSWNARDAKLEPSSGGLVTAIGGIKTQAKKLWVGSLPAEVEPGKIAEESLSRRGKNYHAINVSQKLYDAYYNGMCNNVLWPLLHYESELVRFSESDWKAYQDVNRLFAQGILEVVEDDDLVWVHDFHLFLVPKLLKAKRRNLKVGFFLHVPFPSSEVFRQLPLRKEILESILAADLIGFHDYSYLRHFSNAVYFVLGHDAGMLAVKRDGHTSQLGVFPVSIDTKRYKEEAAKADVKKTIQSLIKGHPGQKLILGVDRLDYIKGIELKLRAFQEMLNTYPDLRGKVRLLQVAIPSRIDVPEYLNLKHTIEQLVGEINGQFGSPTYVPVQYLFTSVDFHLLLAMYRAAQVLLVTSKRDGMNLVALEYIAAQKASDPGVVVLSEFAGAVSTLSHVLRINPWDIKLTAHTTYKALTMEREERVTRYRSMMKYLDTYTASDWAESFMTHLARSHEEQTYDDAKLVSLRGGPNDTAVELIAEHKAQQLLVFMDYDGTLVPIEEEPHLAVLNPGARDILHRLALQRRVQLVVVSGRDARFLERQFKGLPITLAAEHGAMLFEVSSGKWRSLVGEQKDRWFSTARQVMDDYTVRVPDSFIERKQFALAWHYRKSPRDFGSYQARRLKHDLENALLGLPLTVLSGKKVVEVRAAQANKGAFLNYFLANYRDRQLGKLVVLGDDVTDEEMFASAKELGATIKVGEGQTCARYRLERQEDVIPLLQRLCL